MKVPTAMYRVGAETCMLAYKLEPGLCNALGNNTASEDGFNNHLVQCIFLRATQAALPYLEDSNTRLLKFRGLFT